MYWEIKKLKNGKYDLFSSGTKVFRKSVTREQLTEWYVNHAAEAARIEVERLLRKADGPLETVQIPDYSIPADAIEQFRVASLKRKKKAP